MALNWIYLFKIFFSGMGFNICETFSIWKYESSLTYERNNLQGKNIIILFVLDSKDF